MQARHRLIPGERTQVVPRLRILALGRTQTFALIEARQSTPVYTAIFTQGGERLGEVGDELHDMSSRIHKLGSVWEGDAPPANRSVTIN
jgi:hypothetical protein